MIDKVVSVETESFGLIIEDVKYVLSQLENSNDRLKSNYTIDEFFKDSPSLITIVYRDKLPYQISSVISRKIFNGGCRVLNRLARIPSERCRLVNSFIPDDFVKMVNQQLSFASNKYSFAFTSREFNTHLFMKKLCQELTNRSSYDWNYDTTLRLVCNWQTSWGFPSDACWHWIGWCNLSEIDNLPLLTKEDLGG